MENNKKKATELINAIKRLGLTPKEAIDILVQKQNVHSSVKREEIFNYVKDYLEKELFYSKISLESKIIDDLDIDDLDVITLIMDIESKYHISIDDSVAEKWETVEDIVNTVSQLIQI